jgi:predicted transcriptional regulator
VPPTNQGAYAVGTALFRCKPGEECWFEGFDWKSQVGSGKNIDYYKLPSIRKGGLGQWDMDVIKTLYEDFKPERVGVMGAGGSCCSNKTWDKMDFEFGISHSAVVAASRGLECYGACGWSNG